MVYMCVPSGPDRTVGTSLELFVWQLPFICRAVLELFTFVHEVNETESVFEPICPQSLQSCLCSVGTPSVCAGLYSSLGISGNPSFGAPVYPVVPASSPAPNSGVQLSIMMFENVFDLAHFLT